MSAYFEFLKSLKNDVLSPAFHECVRAAPDSLFLGSILLSLFTQSFPLAVFSLAMAEFGLLQRFLANILDSVSDNLKTQGPEICRMGIPSPYQISAIGKLIKEYAFPNGTLFFLSAVIVYIASSIVSFKDEFEQLDQQVASGALWKSRTFISLTFSALLLILFIIYNVLYGCVDVLPAFGSTAIGGFAGLCIFLLHYYLFGKKSINFLGIPTLENRNIIYAAAKSSA
jgi:hypothetical protein